MEKLSKHSFDFYVKKYNIDTNLYTIDDFCIKEDEHCKTLYNIKEDWHYVLHIKQIKFKEKKNE